MNKKIYLCAISNIESGTCNEDCKFCTQSVKYKAKIDRYKSKSIDQIVLEAKKAQKYQAVGFCLVTAGKGLNDDMVESISKISYAIKKVVPNLSLIGCNGTATKEQLKELKQSGIDNYNHNLESSKEYYSQICTTHTWQERYETCINVKEVGLNLCVGGIFGMGESIKDRLSLIDSITSLEPMSIPINFYHPNIALPLEQKVIDKKEAFDIIKLIKNKNPKSMIMVAGGREITFNQDQYKIFDYGANAIVIGDYLTTSGKNAKEDIKQIEALGYNIAQDCSR
jgi:biotin synthase